MHRVYQHIEVGRCNKNDFVMWGGKVVCVLYFADDVVLVARTKKGMEILVTAM